MLEHFKYTTSLRKMSVPVVIYAISASFAMAESVYKVKNGNEVIYSDRAPNSSQDEGHQILNNQGVVTRQVLSREERLKARKRAEVLRLSKIRDRALLATFTSEEDLLLTRDERTGMIDSLIGRLDDRIVILTKRLDILEERIAKFEKAEGEGNAPESLYAEKISVERNIENAWSLIDDKASERRELVDKFTDDLERYRELKIERSIPYRKATR